MQIEFTRPDALYLLAFLPLWALLVWPRAGRGVPYTGGAAPVRRRAWSGARAALILIAPRILRAGALACLIVGLAGPEQIETLEDTVMEGQGIGLVVDVSSSMLAEDMGEQSSRIAVAREAAVRFARRREFDELSLIGFANDAVTRVPPTTDRELIVQGVESLEPQMVRDGTDISAAVLTAISRLLESDREPRVVILLTDGAHNGVELPPLVTARAASALGIRIHTISVLSPNEVWSGRGGAVTPRAFGQERETVLRGLSDLTGGRYFRASSAASLDSIYEEIDRIETPVPRPIERQLRHPLAAWFFLATLVLLGSEALLRGSRWGIIH